MELSKKQHKELIQPMLDKYEIYTMENLDTNEDFVLSFELDCDKIWKEAKKDLLEELLKNSKKRNSYLSTGDIEDMLETLEKSKDGQRL